MKFKRYEKYKSSDIDWLGEIPDGWKVKRLKDVVISNERSLSNNESPDLEMQYIDISNVGTGKLNYNPELFLFKDAPSRARRIPRKNDVIVSTVRTYLKAIYFFKEVKKNTICSTGFSVLTPKNILPIFLKYSLIAEDFINNVISQSKGVSYPAINDSELISLPLFLPKKQIQINISDYLEKHTSFIDKKIELLKAKKQKYTELKKTLISETITKGLDKNIEMKDSGIEWIGKIPKHWGVKRVKEVFEISRGRVIALTELKDKGYPVYSSQTENKGCMGFIESYDFDADLLTWTTDGVNAGTVFLRSGKFNCTNICGTLLPKRKNNIHLGYLGFSVQESAKHNKRIDTNGAKIMSNEMSIIRIVLPPKSEQTAIAHYLDEKTSKIDKITQTIDKNILALQEFRKTLINDVVTGKVKII